MKKRGISISVNRIDMEAQTQSIHSEGYCGIVPAVESTSLFTIGSDTRVGTESPVMSLDRRKYLFEREIRDQGEGRLDQ